MQIRSETSVVVARVPALNVAAFNQNAAADLIDMLRESGDAILSLVAEDDGKIAGHVMFSKLTTPPRCLALAPLAVAPDRQKEGIGTALIKRGLAMAQASRWRAVFVLGDPAYYTRFGFSVEDAAKFDTPYPKDYTMARELVPGALKAMDGALTYAAPFSAFD